MKKTCVGGSGVRAYLATGAEGTTRSSRQNVPLATAPARNATSRLTPVAAASEAQRNEVRQPTVHTKETRMPELRETFDGIPWTALREALNTDPGRDDYFSWSKSPEYASFRSNGSRVTLRQDGTFSIDCAPDWDGSS